MVAETPPKAVVIATASDTVSAAIGCIESLRRALPPWCDIVMAYSCAPPCISERVRAAAGDRPVSILESDTWLPQNERRNRALAAAPGYDFYFFIDLDSRIEPGSLERCIETHRQTGADLVGAVILYGASIDFGREGKRIVHFAGGESRFRPDADGRPGMQEIHAWVGETYEHMRQEVGDKPWENEQLELHGMCLTRRAVEALTPFDPDLMTFEPSDVALQARLKGLKRVMDPQFMITYESAAEYLCDIEPYRQQHASDAAQASVRHFARKYGLPDDGEVVAHQTRWNHQHFEDIGAVTRLAFPAPPLTDLCDHPFAQTWPQLLQQLRRQNWTVQEIERVKCCHEVGRRLANGLYRACGKPFVAHLIGTASILAAYGAPPVLVESAVVHAPYDPLIARDRGSGAANAFIQRVGANVDRVLRNFALRDFRKFPPPASDEDLALYRVDDACALIMRVANEIEEYLDGSNAMTVRRDPADDLLAHARKILPVLGFAGLLEAFERSIALNEELIGSLPDSLADHRKQSYRLREASDPDTLALPDEKWVEVASYLRGAGRQADVIAAPDEFRYLCGAIRREMLLDDPWAGAGANAIVVVHKGRLAGHPSAALVKLMSATPIYANEVFVAFSRFGKSIEAAAQVHIGPIQHAIDNRAS